MTFPDLDLADIINYFFAVITLPIGQYISFNKKRVLMYSFRHFCSLFSAIKLQKKN